MNALITSWLVLLSLVLPPDAPLAKWSFRTAAPVQVGQEVELIFAADIHKKWYLYSSDLNPELGPVPTAFAFQPDDSFELVGGIQPVGPRKKWDRTWDGEITYFEQKAEFRQKVKILRADYHIRGQITGQLCSEQQGECIPFDESFQF